jgi:hypothetical protein
VLHQYVSKTSGRYQRDAAVNLRLWSLLTGFPVSLVLKFAAAASACLFE